MLLNATMADVSKEYNPQLMKAFANLDSFQNHIETTVQQHGGWQPGILEALLDNLSLDHVSDEVDEFTEENLKELKKTLQACLDKGINQKTVHEALSEFVEDQRYQIEQEHGIRLGDSARGGWERSK